MNTNFTQNLIKTGLLVFIITLLTTNHSNAQQLEFSRVLLVKDNLETVPPGKVWQVTSYWQNLSLNVSGTAPYVAATNCESATHLHAFRIDGQSYHHTQYSSGYNNNNSGPNYTHASKNDFPLWLPTGTTLQTWCPNDFLSVIEYTIH